MLDTGEGVSQKLSLLSADILRVIWSIPGPKTSNCVRYAHWTNRRIGALLRRHFAFGLRGLGTRVALAEPLEFAIERWMSFTAVVD